MIIELIVPYKRLNQKESKKVFTVGIHMESVGQELIEIMLCQMSLFDQPQVLTCKVMEVHRGLEGGCGRPDPHRN